MKKTTGIIIWLTRILRAVAGIRLVFMFAAVLFFSALVVYTVEQGRNEGFSSLFDSVWWIIVTVSTVGYGDRFPVTVGGRVIAILIMFLGVGVMGTVTGRIASLLMERKMKEEKGLVSYEKYKGHFVICGWKREMGQLINEMLDTNPQLDPERVILLNKAAPEEISLLRSDPRLKNVRYVNGDFIEERDLVKAGIKEAQRVLVLADHYTRGDLQQIDSKTVMAVMSIKNINKKAYVCAELLDNKFEKYLKLSHCDEVLLSREFSRNMLVAASQGLGTSHVIYALLAQESGVGITTVDLPDALVGKTYGDAREYCSGDSRLLLIGLLENTGNLISRKSEALRETQKNPNIERIISDLRSIKELSANMPVINPPQEYPIKKYTRGIVINGTTETEAVLA